MSNKCYEIAQESHEDFVNKKNKQKVCESKVRGNGNSIEEKQQTRISGLLDDAQSRIQRRSSNLRETQEQGIQSQELASRRNREDETALEKLAKEQGQWLGDDELRNRQK